MRRARAANSRTSFRTLDHVAALPRLLSNDEAEALADCTACRSCLVSVLCMSSEWWRCVCGVLGTGSSRSPRGSGVRLAPESGAECHRVGKGTCGKCRELCKNGKVNLQFDNFKPSQSNRPKLPSIVAAALSSLKDTVSDSEKSGSEEGGSERSLGSGGV